MSVTPVCIEAGVSSVDVDINSTFMLFVAHSVCRGLHPGNSTNCTVLFNKLHLQNCQNRNTNLISKIFKFLKSCYFFFAAVLIQVAKTLSDCALVVVDEASRIYPIHRLASSPSRCDWLCVTEAAGYFPPVVYMATGFLFLTLCCSDLALKRRTSSPTVSEDSSTPKTPLRESAWAIRCQLPVTVWMLTLSS